MPFLSLRTSKAVSEACACDHQAANDVISCTVNALRQGRVSFRLDEWRGGLPGIPKADYVTTTWQVRRSCGVYSSGDYNVRPVSIASVLNKWAAKGSSNPSRYSCNSGSSGTLHV